jgi:hypothetical protein
VPKGAGGGTLDRTAAMKALAPGMDKASRCRMRGASAGTANVAVTFEPSGKVKEANVISGPFLGSPTGKCIVSKLMDATIPAFGGDAQKVVVEVAVR